MKIPKSLYLLLLLSGECFSQKAPDSLGFWHLTSISGEIKLKGLYRKQERISNNISEFPESSLFSSGIMLNSRSYIWHPNFLSIDVDVDYNPEMRQEKYLVIPDRSEVRTLKRLNLRTTFFKQKFITISTFINFNQNYVNRENLTNIKSDNRSWGGLLTIRNKILPFSVNYRQAKWNQKELQTDRIFKNNHSNFQLKATKSFASNDSHEIKFSHNEYFRQDANLFQMNNRTENLNLKNNIFFDGEKKHSFNSTISNFYQAGNDSLNRFQVYENVSFQLPKNIKLTGNYNFYNIQQDIQELNHHSVRFKLGHELFASLKTDLFIEYNKLNHSVYRESNNKGGIGINYIKKIPTGRLALSYKYYKHIQKMDSDPVLLSVINEEYILSDAQIVLLNRAYINIETVIVKDETGTIIYQIDLDFILIERNNFLEIRRIPGGQIADGATIYIDYMATQVESYQYDINNNSFTASILLFNRLIEIYYRTTKQDYKNIETTDLLTLNYFSQNVYGSRITIGFASGGFEFDNYKSSIIPYRMKRYYINLQGNFHKKILFSLIGNIRDYHMINEEIYQKYSDLSGRIAYKLNPQSKLNLEAGYRNQVGKEINLDLITSKIEYTTTIRHLFFTIGLEMYRRNYLSEIINFIGADFQIVRKF